MTKSGLSLVRKKINGKLKFNNSKKLPKSIEYSPFK